METNPVWIEIRCYQDREAEAGGALREAFAAAGIPEQLLEVLTEPRFGRPAAIAGAGAELARLQDAFTGILMARVAQTPEAAAVLRGGDIQSRDLTFRSWHYSRNLTRAQELAGRVLPEDAYPYKVWDWVRVLTWPFNGLVGRVGTVNKSGSQLTVIVQEAAPALEARTYVLPLRPDEVERLPETPPRAWYVLYGAKGQEARLHNAVREQLRKAGLLYRLFDLASPGQGPQTIRLLKDGREQAVAPDEHPGAVFALLSLDEATWQALRRTPGLTGFVGQGQRPVGYPPVETNP